MSSESTVISPDLLAVAFVVESSVAVYGEWQRIIVEYVAQMLKRLSETNPGYRLHMAFVTYATADTFPSPILCKQYFMEYQIVTKDMKDTPERLGVGTTSAGGNRGMAALEGLVAAIELFDILHSCTHSPRPHLNYIFHIASSAPDSSLHPQWNDSPILDSVSWEDLPLELKKRNIHMSSILLRQNLPRFSELHSAVAPGAPKTPWFTLRGSHSVLLSGFPTSQKSTKRSGEVHANERTPDSKRARLTSQAATDTSPKAQAPIITTPSMQPKPSPVVVVSHQQPHQTQPQAQAQLQPQPVAHPAQSQPPSSTLQPQQPPNLAQYKTLVAGFKLMEETVNNLQISIQEARAAGNLNLADKLTQDWANKNAMRNKFKSTILMFQRGMQGSQPPNQPSNTNTLNIPGPSSSTNPGSSTTTDMPTNPSLSNHPSTSPNLSQFPVDGNRNDPQAFAHLMQNRPLGNAGRMPAPNVINAQMQKLIEDQQRRSGPGPGQPNMSTVAATSMAHPSTSLNQSMAMGQPPRQPQPLPQSGPSSDRPAGANAGKPPGSTVIWKGSLSWSGQSQTGKKEMSTYVIASTTNTKNSYVETWPNNLTLAPLREPAVPLTELQAWLKRHQPTLCTFAAQSHGGQEGQANEMNYRMLVQLLSIKHAYATAAWTRPSGEQGHNVLFFPINNLGLVGAFFPLTGIPDFPKPQTTPMVAQPPIAPTIPSAASLPRMTPEIAAKLQALAPEQRDMILAQYRRQQMQMQQNRLNAAGIGMNNNNIAAMNLAQRQNSQQPQQPDLGNNGNGPGAANSSNMFGGNVPGPMLGNYGGMNMMNNMGMAPGQPPPGGMMVGGMSRSVSGGDMMGGGVPGNVSYEMLQSFMQRNQEGGGMGGPV